MLTFGRDHTPTWRGHYKCASCGSNYTYFDTSFCIALVPYVVYIRAMDKVRFQWDQTKNHENQKKHGVPFEVAQYAFADPNRVIAEDLSHSQTEKRY